MLFIAGVFSVFLVRESQTLHGSYVLSMAHGGKVKHCTIKMVRHTGSTWCNKQGFEYICLISGYCTIIVGLRYTVHVVSIPGWMLLDLHVV